MDTDKKLIITEDQAQQILNYLANRPYAEVFQLIPILMNLPEVDKETADTEKEQ